MHFMRSSLQPHPQTPKNI